VLNPLAASAQMKSAELVVRLEVGNFDRSPSKCPGSPTLTVDLGERLIDGFCNARGGAALHPRNSEPTPTRMTAALIMI